MTLNGVIASKIQAIIDWFLVFVLIAIMDEDDYGDCEMHLS